MRMRNRRGRHSTPSNSIPVRELFLGCLAGVMLTVGLQSRVTLGQERTDTPASGLPGPRATHTLVYDTGHRRVLLLDGTWPAIQKDAAEVWAWYGSRWEKISSDGPPARYASASAYDRRRNRVITYGGRVGREEQIVGDTWVWAGGDWHLVPESSMDARDHPAMCYDVTRDRVVLFGGGVFPRVNGPWSTTTWMFDGATWTRVADDDGPEGRVTAMVFDTKRQNVVLFGGVGAPPGQGQPQPNFNDTWTWDGIRWSKVAETGPPARDRHALAYDEKKEVVLLYGGGTSERQFGDMWQWDGTRWTEIPLFGATPGNRSLHAMTYDPVREVTVLYGGNREGKVVEDTWEWNGVQWLCRTGCDLP